MNTAPLFIGLGGLFIGVLIGNTMVGGGAGKAAQKLADENKAQVVALEEQISTLNAQIAGLQEAVAAGDAGRSELGSKIDGAVSSLSDEIEAVSSSIADSVMEVAASGDAQAEALEDQLAALSAEVEQISAAGAVASTTGGVAAAGATVAAVTAAASTGAQEVEAAAALPPAEGFSAGQTVTLLDGKIRAFVSRVDDETGTVRVAINGQGTADLGIFDDLDFNTDEDSCTLKVDAIDRGHVLMSAQCVALPSEETSETVVASTAATAVAPAANVAATAAAPALAEPEGASVGQTVSLLDGKARVFVSGVDAEAGTVRVAVNGQNLAILGGHTPVTFDTEDENCTLNLDGLDRGHAQMSAACVAAAATETAVAEAPAASEAAIAAGAEPKGPGQTAWLLDGKARVFVSGVDADARTARVAINGLSTAILGGPQPVTFASGGATCTLQLDDIVEGRVQMSASCN